MGESRDDVVTTSVEQTKVFLLLVEGGGTLGGIV